MTKSVVYVGADHAGFQLKERIKLMLTREGFVVHDLGNTAFEQTDDYPDFAKLVGEKVAKGRTARGVLCCNNGIGMCIAANKIKGVRAALANNARIAREAVNDDDANVLCLGQGHVEMKEAEEIVRVFLATKFSNEVRHKRRVKKVSELEKNYD
jgi:ribose 5-phosphate isomerase B